MVGALGGSLPARRAAAEIVITATDGWKLSTDGRINTFLSVARGTRLPDMEPPDTGVDDEPTLGDKIASTRLRTGFVESVMAFQLRGQLTDSATVKARVAFWALTASMRTATDA